jgi:hypothetical protein
MHVEQDRQARRTRPVNGAPHEPELRELPPEVAAVLMIVGLLGIILPGPTGTPLFLAGASAFVPGLFQPVERWTRRRFPNIYRAGRAQLDRFLDDLERRYPTNSLASR